MSKQVIHLIKSMYIDIRKISKICHLILTTIAQLLVSSLVLSKLDYCNSLLANISKETIHSLQVVQNNAARLVLRKRKFDHATPLLHHLHWLPVEKRIIYKVCCIVYKTLNTDCPLYLKDLLEVYTPLRNLRSANDKTLLIKPSLPRKIGEQSFSFSAPQFWNSLPRHIRCSNSLETFKTRLKYNLFIT